MNCLVIQYPIFNEVGKEIKTQSLMLNKIGQETPDLDKRSAYAMLGEYGDMLEEVPEQAPAPVTVSAPAQTEGENSGEQEAPEPPSKGFGARRKKAQAPKNK